MDLCAKTQEEGRNTNNTKLQKESQFAVKRPSAQWIFSWIFGFAVKTCCVKIVARKNDILLEIVKKCSSKVINN